MWKYENIQQNIKQMLCHSGSSVSKRGARLLVLFGPLCLHTLLPTDLQPCLSGFKP